MIQQSVRVRWAEMYITMEGAHTRGSNSLEASLESDRLVGKWAVQIRIIHTLHSCKSYPHWARIPAASILEHL
jgi:hypothetical protein